MLDTDILVGFVGSLLHKKFDGQAAIPEFHREIWGFCCDKKNEYVAIAAPRNHAKSTAVTFSYLLAALLFRQHKFAVIVSNTEAQSVLFLGEIKQALIENEDIIKLFGVKKFNKLAETDIIVEMDDGHRFRIMAKGAEQSMRGVKWDSLRPDLIICDDLEDDEQVASKDRREKFRNWFTGALLEAKSSHGRVIVVGTILHMDSLLERLMPKLTDPLLNVEELKITTSKKTMWKAVKYRAHNEDFSKILWAERWPKEKLKTKRQEFIEQGLADVYSREFLNYPIDENSAYFRRDDFLGFIPEDFDKTLSYYAAVDFAVSTADRSDYTVIAIVGVDQNGTLLVKDVRRGRWDASEIIEEMFSVQRRYKPELFTVEKGTIEKALGPFLRKMMLERNVYLNLNPLSPTKDKMSRARSIQARMRAGGIRFDKDATWYPALEDEMVRFPKDRHDDIVDALAWVGLTLDMILDAPTAQELLDEDYLEEFGNYEYTGRSSVTGY